MARSKKHYQWDAEQYAKYSGSQYEWALELIGKLQLQGAEDVLDIGCGDGKVTASIAERLLEGSVLGIDSSGEMIALARRRYGHYPTARLAFEYLDVRELDAVSRFDVVFSNAALHWIKEHGDVLRRVRQAMKTGARFLFQMGGRGNALDVVAVLEAMLSHRKWVSFFINFEFPYGFYGTDEYARWLAEAGLTPGAHRADRKGYVPYRPRRFCRLDQYHLAALPGENPRRPERSVRPGVDRNLLARKSGRRKRPGPC